MSKLIAKTVKLLTLWTTKWHWCGCRDTWGCEAMRKPIGVCRERKTNFWPELIYDIAYSSARVSVSRWVSNEHKKHWDSTDGTGHDKRMLRESARSPQADALSMKRKDLRKEVGFLTGHYWSFYGRLHRMGIRVVPLRFRDAGMQRKQLSGYFSATQPYAFKSRGGYEERGRLAGLYCRKVLRVL